MPEYIPPTVSPTLHPMAELARRYRQTEHGLEAQMTPEEAIAIGGQPGMLWWEVSNHASALFLQGYTADALEVAKRALKMKRAVNTLVNMAVILETMGRFEEALEYEEQACGLVPLDDRATALYGEALLRMGRFAAGWPLYVKNRASMDWCKMFIPEWEGPHQDLRRKKIIVIEGGGYGDNIYFLRWMAALQQWGAEVTYLCQPSIAPLARYLGYQVIENWQGNVDICWTDYHYFVPLLSLGHKFGVTIENYKWNGPYVWVRHQRRRMTVGFCWKAGEAKSPRKQRSLTNEQRERITKALPKGYKWVNLSHGHTDDQMVSVKMDNWLDTAKAIAGLSAVVTVDTGVAHLAGAMGITCWTILPGAAAWQYPLGHDRHPLYPSMRIFRNPREGMEEAVDYVVAELSKY
jgi:tetratricopeptide (TPR) repeat protein